MDLSKNY